MNTFGAAIILVLVAGFFANLPFITERFFFFFQKPQKTLRWRLVELIAFYCLFLAVGLAVESFMGRVQSQGWQFYAITFLMFMVLAYPGVVWRYLRRRRSEGGPA